MLLASGVVRVKDLSLFPSTTTGGLWQIRACVLLSCHQLRHWPVYSDIFQERLDFYEKYLDKLDLLVRFMPQASKLQLVIQVIT